MMTMMTMMMMMMMIIIIIITFIYSIKYISKVKNAINCQIKKPACPNADKRKQKDCSKFCTKWSMKKNVSVH